MTDEEIKKALEICELNKPQNGAKGILDSEFTAAAREGWPKALKEIQRLKKQEKEYFKPDPDAFSPFRIT